MENVVRIVVIRRPCSTVYHIGSRKQYLYRGAGYRAGVLLLEPIQWLRALPHFDAFLFDAHLGEPYPPRAKGKWRRA